MENNNSDMDPYSHENAVKLLVSIMEMDSEINDDVSAAKQVDKSTTTTTKTTMTTTTEKRRNPPWLDPSWEWGDGKYKIDGRKKFKKNKDKEKTVEKKSENDDEIHLRKEAIAVDGGCSGCGGFELSVEDLRNEYNSLPPQVPEWLWCIEYVAKFHKDLRIILDLMNMGYPSRNDYGKRINEILSLRILEFMFDDPKGKNIVDDETQTRIEFDLSLSNVDVLNAILKEIPVSELRQGMPELSKFNVLPFIAHKNKNLPQCALEKMKDLGLMEKNQTSDDRSAQQDEKEVNINKDKVIIIDDEEEDEDNNEEVAGVICSKDGVWLIDDEPDHNIATTSRSEKNNGCWKCKKDKGKVLLICSRSDCGAKVHKECMNCEANFDEFGKFLCPVCWFDRVADDYDIHLEMENAAKAKLVKFLPLLTKVRKRLFKG